MAVESSDKPEQEGEAHLFGKWRIIKKLGSGGQGVVYEAEKDGEKCAFKHVGMKARKMELEVLQALAGASSHACQLLDTITQEGSIYVAMTLLGPSLDELRKSFKESRFTMGCAISVSMECLEAIQQLHNTGYLHRDVKPANFAVGLTNPRHIVLVDFGNCHKFVEKGLHRPPRTTTRFRGTWEYASLRAHECVEQSRKDDLESWIYQTVQLTSGRLPWNDPSSSHKGGTEKMKKSARENWQQLFAGCPKEYIYMLMYVDKLDYYDQPKYSILRGLLRDALTANQLEEFPYDWEKEEE